MASHAGDADIIVVNKVRIGARELDALPKLKLIAIAATGYDNVDVDARARKGVAVTNIRGYSVEAVPEHVFALILALQPQHLRLCAGRAGRAHGRTAASSASTILRSSIFAASGSA